MRRKKAIQNYTEGSASNVDCTTCVEKRTCEHAQEGSFCGKWHSRTAEKATWDTAMLREELEGLQVDFDMGAFGFEDADIREPELEEVAVDEDEVPALSTPRCKAGDVWQLGDHRLICGDSTDPRVIEALMDGEEAAAVCGI